MTVDSHQHFWRYSAAEYGWIDEDMRAIRRDFLPKDLGPERRAAGIDTSIAVQARQSLEETDWLLALAADEPAIAGVVGWLPLADEDIDRLLERYAAHPRLVGLRHVIQAEGDPRFLRGAAFNRGIDLTARAGLAYDLLIRADQLPEAIALVDRHPDTRFVLDHIAKPRIKEGVLSPWREDIRELAKRGQVWCKLSGLVTEADYHNWEEIELRPYLDSVVEAFGPRRLLFGSDWPVCTVACGYKRWAGIIAKLAASLGEDGTAAIMGENAVRAYGLGDEGEKA